MQRTLIAALVMSSALLLVGCEDEPEPTFEPTPSEATSSETATEPTDAETTDAGPVEPTLPDEAKEPTKAGAEAFVEYYWEVVSYAQKSGDVASLKELQTEYCEVCVGGTEAIERIYERGGHIEGGTYDLLDVSASEASGPEGSWFANARVRVGRQVVRGAGSLNETYPAGTDEYGIGLRFEDRWRVSQIGDA